MADKNKPAAPVDNEPTEPEFGDDYDEAPEATVEDADFDAEEQNPKEVTE